VFEVKGKDKMPVLVSLKTKPKRDYFIFFILVPLIIFVIYLLPENIRNIFILYPSNPTIISVFLSNYTHTGFTHLSGNVFNYFVVGFLIFVFEAGRKRFYINMLLLFTVLPVLCSLLTLYYLPNSASWGFSGIVAGWMGYLLYAVYGYIKEEWRIALNANFVFLMVMINLLILLSIYKWLGWLYGLLLSLLLILIVLIRNDLRAMVRKLVNMSSDFGMELRKSWKSFGFIFVKSGIFALTINFLLFGFFDLFPPQIKINGTIVNILVHYSWYCFGVFVPLMIDFLILKLNILRKVYS
jgi:hypothetical protein